MNPSPFLVRVLEELPHGAALDLAAGEGRHSHLLEEHGWSVTAVDRAPGPVDRVHRVVADLEDGSWQIPPGQWNVIVVINYLWRPLFGQIVAGLAPGGALVYETFTTAYPGPIREAFRLHPNELLDAFRPALHVVLYEEREKASLLAFKKPTP
ncbi:MAG: class I SAM-dependent methyltransferase [Candidatus Xenobia bacterium]